MKHFFLLFFFHVLFLLAQSQKTSFVSLSYGFPNLAAISLSTDIEKGFLSPAGPILLSYNKQFTNRFSAGIQTAYSKARSKQLTSGNLTYRYDITLFTLMLRSDYYYKNTERLSLYSGVAAGLLNVSGSAQVLTGSNTPPDFSDAANQFAFQINAFGIRLALEKTFGLTAEIGFGFNGFANVGFYKRF